jgi:hypothetical protein
MSSGLQIHECFDALLEVIQLQGPPLQPPKGGSSSTIGPLSPAQSVTTLRTDSAQEEAFFKSTALRLLDLPYIRKGRYLPLASLVRCRGAGWLQAMRPDLIRQMLLAMQVGGWRIFLFQRKSCSEVMSWSCSYQEDNVASSASNLLRVVLQSLRTESSSTAPLGTQQRESDADGDRWRASWLPELVQTLYSGSEKLRGYVAAHALPVVLVLDPGSAEAMLRKISADAAEGAPEPCPGTSRVAAVVAVLKVCVTRNP